MVDTMKEEEIQMHIVYILIALNIHDFSST
jgi:hypothetical protein